MSDDLVQRLRALLHFTTISPRHHPQIAEAADRIEALQIDLHTARVVNREALSKECDDLHETNAELVKRITKLETALRKIADLSPECHWCGRHDIARRALEGKP